MNEPRWAKPDYCQGVPRRQIEATTWGGAHVPCQRKAVIWDDRDPAGWFCRLHADPNKRYGVN